MVRSIQISYNIYKYLNTILYSVKRYSGITSSIQQKHFQFLHCILYIEHIYGDIVNVLQTKLQEIVAPYILFSSEIENVL